MFFSRLSLSQWQKIVLALILGVLVGGFLPRLAIPLEVLGTLFIRAIHLLVAPLVFFAVVCAILSVDSFSLMKRVTFRAVLLYITCMLVAAFIALCVFHLIEPGAQAHWATPQSSHLVHHIPSVSSMITNVLPDNAFSAFLHGNVLQIVVFAILIGVSIQLVGEEAAPVKRFFIGFSKVSFKLAELVMRTAPLGVFSLIAWTVAHFGWHVLSSLAAFVLTVYLGCAIQLFVVYSALLLVSKRKSPAAFFKGILPALLFAFSTSSSAATLPESMRCAENFGVSKSLARFLLPLGASFNLNGLTIYLVSAVLFAANLYGIHLSMLQVLTMLVTTVFTAMGVAAVPGSALIAMGAIMSASGIPLGAIALIAGVDRLNDMMQTATNVAGDLAVTVVLASDEKRSS